MSPIQVKDDGLSYTNGHGYEEHTGASETYSLGARIDRTCDWLRKLTGRLVIPCLWAARVNWGYHSTKRRR